MSVILVDNHGFASIGGLSRSLGSDGFGTQYRFRANGSLGLDSDPDPAPFGTLRGHVARANPVWWDVSPGAEALVIFQGPDTYISPSWYPTKTETAKVVPHPDPLVGLPGEARGSRLKESGRV